MPRDSTRLPQTTFPGEMSDNEENNSHAGFDTLDHQPVYIYAPANSHDDAPTRSAKRRKVTNSPTSILEVQTSFKAVSFEPLLNGLEKVECVTLRQETFERAWSETEAQIQSILDKANEDTLREVTTFVNGTRQARGTERVPTGFIETGPNIASQSLLFKQLSARLKTEINGPIVVLRSGDASNLKSVLKQLIRDATNHRPGEDDEEVLFSEQNGRKLLNYDLEILHGYVKARGSQAAVIAFQDSEAFDSSLISELVNLFSSWTDRIPFVLLFGIATSLDLFHERLSRAASCFLDGVQFNVEQTSSLLERIFEKAVSGFGAKLRLGSIFVSSLMERQHDHVQSVQSFIAALKYAYMCHFYGNPLSWLCDDSISDSLAKLTEPYHLEAIRTLPSFQRTVERFFEERQLGRAKALIEDDAALTKEIEDSLDSRNRSITRLLRAMFLLSTSSPHPIDRIELYTTAFQGGFIESDFLKGVLDSIKRMTPDDLVTFIKGLRDCIATGNPEMDLAGWADEEDEFLGEIGDIYSKVLALARDSVKSGKPVRSSYAIHSKGVRTTVIAQRVQLSYEKSTLTEEDKEFTALVDRLTSSFIKQFTLENPHELFLNEVWLFDSTSPYKTVFTPRPRGAIELALSAPYHYLNCGCCESIEGLSSTHPATAILYQMYLETGSLINIFDLWSAFFEMVGGGEEQKCDERHALVLFYRALADLKSLGMVKQSKKKADHLAKVAWKGL